MEYLNIGNSGVQVSRLAMGGHEYLPDGKSRGFNENMQLAVTPGHIFEGFGGDARKEVLRTAFDHGINYFDVTLDSEKEALGRNLRELGTPYDIYIQTRPEGMVYSYDPHNAKMAQYSLLKAEVERILTLLGRERVEFLNIAFLKTAWQHDPDYFDKMAENIRRLKQEGLILFACADTFSGEETYLKQIESGAYDVVYINFNFGDDKAKEKVFPACVKHGIGIIAREAFMKGKLFHFSEEAGIEDRALVASAALKWLFSHEEVTSLIYGTGKTKNLQSALRVMGNLVMSEEERQLIEKIKRTEGFIAFEKAKTLEFMA